MNIKNILKNLGIAGLTAVTLYTTGCNAKQQETKIIGAEKYKNEGYVRFVYPTYENLDSIKINKVLEEKFKSKKEILIEADVISYSGNKTEKEVKEIGLGKKQPLLEKILPF